jgi:hypothetical protein
MASWKEFYSKLKFIYLFQDMSILSYQKKWYLSHLIHTLMVTAHQLYVHVRPILSYCEQIMWVQEQPWWWENGLRNATHCVRTLCWGNLGVSLMDTVHNGCRVHMPSHTMPVLWMLQNQWPCYINKTLCGNIPTNAKRPFPRGTTVVGLPTTATSSSRQPIPDGQPSDGQV